MKVNPQPLQTLSQMAQRDSARNVQLRALDEGARGREPAELSLSDAAQRLAAGKPVTLEQRHEATLDLTVPHEYTHEPQQHQLQPGLQPQTRLTNVAELQQFSRFHAGAAPESSTEALAARLAPQVSLGAEGMNYILPVQTSWLRGERLGSSHMSAFAAARALEKGAQLALVHTPYGAMVHAEAKGAPERALENSWIDKLGAVADLDPNRPLPMF